jgi:hypothetical protein
MQTLTKPLQSISLPQTPPVSEGGQKQLNGKPLQYADPGPPVQQFRVEQSTAEHLSWNPLGTQSGCGHAPLQQR